MTLQCTFVANILNYVNSLGFVNIQSHRDHIFVGQLGFACNLSLDFVCIRFLMCQLNTGITTSWFYIFLDTRFAVV